VARVGALGYIQPALGRAILHVDEGQLINTSITIDSARIVAARLALYRGVGSPSVTMLQQMFRYRPGRH
jgi:hypothetical protein